MKCKKRKSYILLKLHFKKDTAELRIFLAKISAGCVLYNKIVWSTVPLVSRLKCVPTYVIKWMTHPLRVAENCTTHPMHKAQTLMTHPISDSPFRSTTPPPCLYFLTSPLYIYIISIRNRVALIFR